MSGLGGVYNGKTTVHKSHPCTRFRPYATIIRTSMADYVAHSNEKTLCVLGLLFTQKSSYSTHKILY